MHSEALTTGVSVPCHCEMQNVPMDLSKPDTKLPLTRAYPRLDQKGAQNNLRETSERHAPVTWDTSATNTNLGTTVGRIDQISICPWTKTTQHKAQQNNYF